MTMIPSRISEIQTRIGDIIRRFDPPPAQNKTAQAPEKDKNAFASMLGDFVGDGTNPNPAIEQSVKRQAARHGVPEELVKAVIQAESAGNPKAVSKTGAIGLMQLMPQTAKELGVDPYDVDQNLDGGIRYLKDMAREFGNIKDALAAYNAGPGAVKKFGGIPPYEETQKYVSKIRKTLRQWRA